MLNADKTLDTTYVVLMSTDRLKNPEYVAEYELACVVWPANTCTVGFSFPNCGV